MICPYSFDVPIGSGIPSLLDGRYWCMGWIALGMSARRSRCPEDCPVDFGEWGAWRAVVIDILNRLAYEEGKIGYESWWPSLAIIRTELAAVGWSP